VLVQNAEVPEVYQQKREVIMFKFIGAVICGVAAAGTVAYFAMRPTEQRANDMEQAKGTINKAVDSLKAYFSELFQSKPNASSNGTETQA